MYGIAYMGVVHPCLRCQYCIQAVVFAGVFLNYCLVSKSSFDKTRKKSINLHSQLHFKSTLSTTIGKHTSVTLFLNLPHWETTLFPQGTSSPICDRLSDTWMDENVSVFLILSARKLVSLIFFFYEKINRNFNIFFSTHKDCLCTPWQE